jgi:uncharacterized protein (DUF849 family)
MDRTGVAAYAIATSLRGPSFRTIARSTSTKKTLAARLGCATRVGFEDGLRLPDGRLAENNAALVREAVAILEMQASAAG